LCVCIYMYVCICCFLHVEVNERPRLRRRRSNVGRYHPLLPLFFCIIIISGQTASHFSFPWEKATNLAFTLLNSSLLVCSSCWDAKERRMKRHILQTVENGPGCVPHWPFSFSWDHHWEIPPRLDSSSEDE